LNLGTLEQLIRRLDARASLVGLLLLQSGAYGQVLINPVVVELGARQRATAVTVTLSSKAHGSLLLQSQVLQWAQAIDGSPQYQPSKDLVVAPPIAELKPGESQVFRVALRGARRDSGELAYRLVLEDTAQATSDGSNGGVSFRLRYDLPVLVAPVEPVRNASRWHVCAAKDGEACVRLNNEGNRRITFQTLSVEGAGWTRPIEAPGTVLAGAQREWRVPLAAGQTGAALRVTGTLRTGEPVQAELSIP
jgi:fimbrial chaperone protein